jgi:hypothetical protein
MGQQGVTRNECPFLLPWEDNAPAPPAVDSAGQCKDYLIDFMNLLSLDISASRATSKTPTAAWSFFTVYSQQSIKPQSSSVAMLVIIYNKGRRASGDLGLDLGTVPGGCVKRGWSLPGVWGVSPGYVSLRAILRARRAGRRSSLPSPRLPRRLRLLKDMLGETGGRGVERESGDGVGGFVSLYPLHNWIPAPRFHEDKLRGNDIGEMQQDAAGGLGVSPNSLTLPPRMGDQGG